MRECQARICVGLACVLAGATLQGVAQTPNTNDLESLKKADAAFHEAFAAQQRGDLELARVKYAEVVQLAPQIAEGHEALGTVLLELNKAPEAIAELERAVALKPGDATDESNLAVAYAQAGDAAKAIPHFEAALQAAGSASAVNAAFGQNPNSWLMLV